MAPKLRVLAGTSPETMVPITPIINTNESYHVSSELFDGDIAAHIKNFTDETGNVRESEYFSREDRQGITWSIQVRGRFLIPCSADDILFGSTFDRRLRLPWGIGAVLKFMNYIDPTLQHDLQSTKPWALSRFVSTMPHFTHSRVHQDRSSPVASGEPSLWGKTRTFPPAQSIVDSTPELYKTLRDCIPSSGSSSSLSPSLSTLSSKSRTSSSSEKSDTIKGAFKKVTHMTKREKTDRPSPGDLQFENASARRSYFSSAAHRQAVVFGPSDIITTDFCYGFIMFSPSLVLRLPGGLSFNLMQYWDGQPVRFMCCERKDGAGNRSDDTEPWGRIFWCIAIEVCDEK
ncbi:hypothetical protein AN958_05850 [Leucoagaricus sp. SymC.cos]|nr:hypothetical protein AN958_05850 [Leucoagaricus sp. SymC.cos]